MKKIFRHWKILYTVCSIIYISWVIHVGGNEFDRVNSQYNRLERQLEPDRIMAATMAELATECRRELSRQLKPPEDVCTDWASAAVEAKRAEIVQRRIEARERGIIKMVLFYTGFVVIFLLGPVLLVYLLILAIITLYKNITIVR